MSAEQRQEFDRLLGMHDSKFDPDDELIPKELRGVPRPSWWDDGGGQSPGRVMGSLRV